MMLHAMPPQYLLELGARLKYLKLRSMPVSKGLSSPMKEIRISRHLRGFFTWSIERNEVAHLQGWATSAVTFITTT